MCHTWMVIKSNEFVTSVLSSMIMKSNVMGHTWVTEDGYEAYVMCTGLCVNKYLKIFQKSCEFRITYE